MNPFGWLDAVNAVSPAWAEAMTRACWQGGLAILAAWGACGLFARRSGRAQCWLWRVGYGKCLICLLAIAPLSLPLLPAQVPSKIEPVVIGPISAKFGSSASEIKIAEPVPVTAPDEDAPPSLPPSPIPAAMQSFTSRPAPAPLAAVSITSWLMMLWLPGVFGCLLRITVAWTRTRDLRRSARTIADPGVYDLAWRLAEVMRIRKLPDILCSEKVDSPLLLGIVRPAIVLPAALGAHCGNKQLRLVLAHELAHAKRRDLAWNLAQSLAGALFFFHPLIWLTRRPWREAQEMACDDIALTATACNAAEYGRTLLDVVAHQSFSRRRLLGVGVAESAGTLRRRLLAMKNLSRWSRKQLAMAAIIVAAVGAVGLVPWRVVAQEAATAPQAQAIKPAPSGPAPVLVGILKDDSGYTAILAVPGSDGTSKTLTVRKGDLIDWDNSRISDITLDSLHLEGGSQSKEVVNLGHNLRDETVPNTAAPRGFRGRNTAVATSGGFSASAGNTVAAPDPPLPAGSADDIAARMSALRALQQGAPVPIPIPAPAAQANGPAIDKRDTPVFWGADPKNIEASDKWITQVIPLKYADATRLRMDLTLLFSPDATVAASTSSNSLVVTDTASHVRHLVEIIAALDVPTTVQSPQARFTGSGGPTARPVAGGALPAPAANGSILALGTLTAPTFDIRARADGAVSQVSVKEGQQVKKGDELFKFDSKEVVAEFNIAQARVSVAKAKLEDARGNPQVMGEIVQRDAELSAEQAVLEAKKAELDQLTLRSPSDGVVTSCDVRAEQFVSKGATLAKVVNVNELTVSAQVPTAPAVNLKPGQRFTFVSSIDPQKEYPGKITSISPTVDSATGTINIRGSLSGDISSLKPGMLGNVSVAGQ